MEVLHSLLMFIILSVVLNLSYGHNKYSKEENKHEQYQIEQNDRSSVDFRPISVKHLDRPYRMAKLNLLWSKAIHVGVISFAQI